MPESIYPRDDEKFVFVGGNADGMRLQINPNDPVQLVGNLNIVEDEITTDEYRMVRLVFQVPTLNGFENRIIKYMRHTDLDDEQSMRRLLMGYRRKPRRKQDANQP